MQSTRRRVLKTIAAALSVPALAQAQTAGAPLKLAMIEALSGAFANTGEAVFRNLLWAVERVNARGGVKLPGGAPPAGAGALRQQGPDRGGAGRRCARPSTTARASCCRATRRPWRRR